MEVFSKYFCSSSAELSAIEKVRLREVFDQLIRVENAHGVMRGSYCLRRFSKLKKRRADSLANPLSLNF